MEREQGARPAAETLGRLDGSRKAVPDDFIHIGVEDWMACVHCGRYLPIRKAARHRCPPVRAGSQG